MHFSMPQFQAYTDTIAFIAHVKVGSGQNRMNKNIFMKIEIAPQAKTWILDAYQREGMYVYAVRCSLNGLSHTD